MKILALDSSGLVASAAIVTEDAVLAEYSTNYQKTHSQTLLPMLDAIVQMTNTKLSEVDAIAVTVGPGSFTGLRIGSATVKGLGQALSKPIVSVPTTLALAWNFAGSEALVCPLMDARRSQVYTGLYVWNKETRQMDGLTGQMAVPVEEITERVNALGRPVIYLGDGLSVYRSVLEEKTKVPYTLAPVHLRFQSGGSVAACAIAYLQSVFEGKDFCEAVGKEVSENEVRLVDAASFVPVYLRKSQAEREREEQEKKAEKE